MISEIVCPGVLLLGEVVMEPEKVTPYFGSIEKPECHMLYNVTTMATMWHTVATRNVRLLKKQLDIVNTLPKDYVFLNYLRCHDDIGWGLDYAALKTDGIEERSHKKYLNEYFLGYDGVFCFGKEDMQMLKIAICDDSRVDVEWLEGILDELCHYPIYYDVYFSAEELLEYTTLHKENYQLCYGCIQCYHV